MATVPGNFQPVRATSPLKHTPEELARLLLEEVPGILEYLGSRSLGLDTAARLDDGFLLVDNEDDTGAKKSSKSASANDVTDEDIRKVVGELLDLVECAGKALEQCATNGRSSMRQSFVENEGHGARVFQLEEQLALSYERALQSEAQLSAAHTAIESLKSTIAEMERKEVQLLAQVEEWQVAYNMMLKNETEREQKALMLQGHVWAQQDDQNIVTSRLEATASAIIEDAANNGSIFGSTVEPQESFTASVNVWADQILSAHSSLKGELERIKAQNCTLEGELAKTLAELDRRTEENTLITTKCESFKERAHVVEEAVVLLEAKVTELTSLTQAKQSCSKCTECAVSDVEFPGDGQSFLECEDRTSCEEKDSSSVSKVGAELESSLCAELVQDLNTKVDNVHTGLHTLMAGMQEESRSVLAEIGKQNDEVKSGLETLTKQALWEIQPRFEKVEAMLAALQGSVADMAKVAENNKASDAIEVTHESMMAASRKCEELESLLLAERQRSESLQVRINQEMAMSKMLQSRLENVQVEARRSEELKQALEESAATKEDLEEKVRKLRTKLVLAAQAMAKREVQKSISR